MFKSIIKIIANMLKSGKQSSLKMKWNIFLKSSSLFVRIHVSTIVYLKFLIFLC